LDAIAARQYIIDFPSQYAAANIGAGFTKDRQPFHDAEALTIFLMSLPSCRVAAMIQLHYLKDIARDWTINDLRDIAALSAAIVLRTPGLAPNVSGHRCQSRLTLMHGCTLRGCSESGGPGTASVISAHQDAAGRPRRNARSCMSN
jgi:hypothetical protein